MEDVYTIYTDGGSRGNPGPAGIGFVVKKGDELLLEKGDYIGDATNNVAEYTAILSALGALDTLPKPHAINFYLDSLLVVEQLKGNYKMKNAGLLPLYTQVLEHLKALSVPYTISHIPRLQNAHADKLVNQALDLRAKESHAV